MQLSTNQNWLVIAISRMKVSEGKIQLSCKNDHTYWKKKIGVQLKDFNGVKVLIDIENAIWANAIKEPTKWWNPYSDKLFCMWTK